MRKDFPNIALASTEKVEDGLDPKEARTGKSVLGLESVEKGKLPDDRPTVFRLSAHDTVEEIKRRLDCEIQDDYRDHYLNELFEIRNPQVRLDTVEGYEKLQEYLSKRANPSNGNWAYYPWENKTIHIPEELEFREIAFSRNYPIIEKETQEKLWQLRVGIAGLSVGSSVATMLARTGVGNFIIADPDTISLSNTPRIEAATVFDVGKNKTRQLLQKIYAFNPYIAISPLNRGITDDNIHDFVLSSDVIIDEIDDIEMKVKLRDVFRSNEGKQQLLIMGTDLAESPIIDVSQPHDPIFGGRIDGSWIRKGQKDRLQMFTAVVGKENIPPAMKRNLLNILNEEQSYFTQVAIAGAAISAKIANIVVEVARGNGDKLARFWVLDLQQPDLIDRVIQRRINEEFDRRFSTRGGA